MWTYQLLWTCSAREFSCDINEAFIFLIILNSLSFKSGTLSLYLSVPVPVLTPSVVISRSTTASRPSTPLNPSPLAPQSRLCWPLCAFINYIYLLTYLLSNTRRASNPILRITWRKAQSIVAVRHAADWCHVPLSPSQHAITAVMWSIGFVSIILRPDR